MAISKGLSHNLFAKQNYENPLKQKIFSNVFCCARHTNLNFTDMSDGNYNRNLLPYHQYQSGLKAGRAQMHTLALRAFKAWLDEQPFNEEERKAHELRFRHLLDPDKAATPAPKG